MDEKKHKQNYRNDMSDLINFWDNNALYIVFIFLYIIIVSVILNLIFDKIFTKRRDLEKAYKLILKALEQDTLTSDSIALIYRRQIERKYNISYIDFLELFLMYVRQEDKDGSLTKVVTLLINPLLTKAKEEKPYSFLGDRERRILLAIEEAYKKGEETSLKNNLTDLSDIIDQNQKALIQSQRTNRWTIPISIIGIILTLFIWIYGSRISNKDIDRISEKVSIDISNNLQLNAVDSISSK